MKEAKYIEERTIEESNTMTGRWKLIWSSFLRVCGRACADSGGL